MSRIETVEEFLARGGEIKYARAPKYQGKSNSRFSYSELQSRGQDLKAQRCPEKVLRKAKVKRMWRKLGGMTPAENK